MAGAEPWQRSHAHPHEAEELRHKKETFIESLGLSNNSFLL